MSSDQSQTIEDGATTILLAKELEKAAELGVKLFTEFTDAHGLPRLNPTEAMQLGAAVVAYATSGALEAELASARQNPVSVMAQFDSLLRDQRDRDRQEQRRLAIIEEDRRQATRQREAGAVLQRSRLMFPGMTADK